MKQALFAFIVGVLSVGLMDSGFLSHKETPVVSTNDGLVRGYSDLSRDGRPYYSFVGIPYAKPPLGNLRFQPPIPPAPWNGIRDAMTYGSECYQFDGLVEAAFKGDEDCLYLNVYTPNPNASLPVMVWIYGGGFVSGSANMYNPKYFMDENVVIASMNYRVGPLGFLNTGDGVVRGNMGLKDQNLALKWVNKNIHKFGGNPKKITIFGESAGAASVQYHLLSPASKDLFQKGIMQSGSALSPWAFTKNPKEQALRFAEKTKCASKKDSQSIVSCLRKLSPQELCAPLFDTMVDAPVYDSLDMFTPSVEATTESDTFLSEPPLSSLVKATFAKVPVIIGATSGEGGLRTARLEKNERILKSLDDKWDEYIPHLQYYDQSRPEVNKAIKKEFFTSPFSKDYPGVLKNFTVMMTEGHFYHSINRAVKYHSKSAPVYYYFYDYRSSVPSLYSTFKAVDVSDKLHHKILIAASILKDYFSYYFGYPGPHEYGPCHADDLLQEWRAESLFEIGRRMWGKDYNFSKAFVKMLVDFASRDDEVHFNGIPWPKVDSTKVPFQCMKIDKTPQVISEPFHSRLSFWDNLKIRNLR